jgi:hypothetical protein
VQESPSWQLKIGVYLLHCSVAAVGVLLISVLMGAILEKALTSGLIDPLFNRPACPIQIAIGFTIGLLFNRHMRSRSAIFAWIPAALCLLVDVRAYMQIGGLHYLGDHLFGTNCGECIERFFVVSPFYASVAYSVGAWLALKTSPA